MKNSRRSALDLKSHLREPREARGAGPYGTSPSFDGSPLRGPSSLSCWFYSVHACVYVCARTALSILIFISPFGEAIPHPGVCPHALRQAVLADFYFYRKAINRGVGEDWRSLSGPWFCWVLVTAQGLVLLLYQHLTFFLIPCGFVRQGGM